ncbi:hypothetical protein J3R82DRAFT_2898 [Butyriboletus roseoflavus]|nr:hypothetical protein J3R82DRAFT_2898 [Butyriboletus roseoflavus]
MKLFRYRIADLKSCTYDMVLTQTPRDHRSGSPSSPDLSASIDSQRPAKRNRYESRSRSRSYERSRNCHRSGSRSRSHERERRRPTHKEKDRDRKKRHKDKDKKREKDEKRSVLTGKKIKLKVHKDSRDLEMDANRQDLLQFLNSTFE